MFNKISTTREVIASKKKQALDSFRTTKEAVESYIKENSARAKDSILDKGDQLKGQFCENSADFRDRIQGQQADLKNLVRDTSVDLKDMTKEILDKQMPKLHSLESYIPTIKELLKTHVGTIALNTVNDDELMEKSFSVVYRCLPTVVQFAFNEDKFVAFCLQNRNTFLENTSSRSADGTVSVIAQPTESKEPAD